MKKLVPVSDGRKSTISRIVKDAVGICNVGECPFSIDHEDHRLHDNPYLSKYGADQWEDHIAKSPTLRNCHPISTIIEHMGRCTCEVMKGTKYEGKGLFFHDALSQLTEPETIKWMKDNRFDDGRTYFDMWIKLELGCNDSICDS